MYKNIESENNTQNSGNDFKHNNTTEKAQNNNADQDSQDEKDNTKVKVSAGLVRTTGLDKNDVNQQAEKGYTEIMPNDGKIGVKIDISLLERNIPPPSWRVIAVDIESTGTFEIDDHMIELGAVEIIDCKMTGVCFHSQCKFRKEGSHEEAQQVHKIRPDMVKNEPGGEEVVERFMKWALPSAEESGWRPSCLIGHNVGFDRRMINKELERMCSPIIPEERFQCTYRAMRESASSMSDQNLERCAKLMGINNIFTHRTTHNALADAKLHGMLYLKLAELLPGMQPSPQKPLSSRLHNGTTEPNGDQIDSENTCNDDEKKSQSQSGPGGVKKKRKTLDELDKLVQSANIKSKTMSGTAKQCDLTEVDANNECTINLD